MVGATVVGGAVGALSLTGSSRRYGAISGLRIERPFISASFLKLHQGQRRNVANVLCLRNVGFLQRNCGLGRLAITGAMAEESSEVSVTTEDRALTPVEGTAEDNGLTPVEDSAEDKGLTPVDDTAEDKGVTPVEDTAEDEGLTPVEDTAEDKGLTSVEGTAEGKGLTPVEDTTGDRTLTPEEEEDQSNISEILRVVELLKKKRDMTSNEVRLTIMIEDPREVERRRQLGIEDERGCSKEDMGNALQEIFDGRVPEDRLVLRELTKEMLIWPNLEEEVPDVNPFASPYAKITPTGVDPKVAAQRAKVDWDAAAEIQPGEVAKDLSDMVPPAVGL